MEIYVINTQISKCFSDDLFNNESKTKYDIITGKYIITHIKYG